MACSAISQYLFKRLDCQNPDQGLNYKNAAENEVRARKLAKVPSTKEKSYEKFRQKLSANKPISSAVVSYCKGIAPLLIQLDEIKYARSCSNSNKACEQANLADTNKINSSLLSLVEKFQAETKGKPNLDYCCAMTSDLYAENPTKHEYYVKPVAFPQQVAH